MGITAENRYNKLNRQQIDEWEQSLIIKMEQEIANLKSDLAEAQGKLADSLIEMDEVKERAKRDVRLARKDADERCKHAETEHKYMMHWMQMYKQADRNHRKASAILRFWSPEQVQLAYGETKLAYPHLWQETK